ncbi:MAG: hypothetical protein JNK39_11465 [Nitrosomonas sp.]|nr:hypothetical protein [Nitrosomonas sp.]MBL8498429.1 hypothetical protein [Nitrosomonas sp.]
MAIFIAHQQLQQVQKTGQAARHAAQPNERSSFKETLIDRLRERIASLYSAHLIA